MKNDDVCCVLQEMRLLLNSMASDLKLMKMDVAAATRFVNEDARRRLDRLEARMDAATFDRTDELMERTAQMIKLQMDKNE